MCYESVLLSFVFFWYWFLFFLLDAILSYFFIFSSLILILIATFGPRCQQIAIYENVHDTETLWPFIYALDYVSAFGELTKGVSRGERERRSERVGASQQMIYISWSTIWKYKKLPLILPFEIHQKSIVDPVKIIINTARRSEIW